MRPVPVRPNRRLHPFRHADTTSPDSLLCSPPNYSTSEVWFLLRCQHRHCKPLFFFYSRWEQAGYALWSCNAASSNLFHWSTVGENKPRNENKRLRASNISFFQKIVGYKYFMRRIFFIYVLFKDISDTQCSLVRNCEWLLFFFVFLQNDPQVTPKSFISTSLYKFVFISSSIFFPPAIVWTLIFTQFYSNAFPNTRQDKVLINNQGLVNLGHETLVLSLYVQRWNVWFWNRLKTMCDCVKGSVCRVRSQVFLSSLCAAMFLSRFSTKVCLYFLYFVLYRKDHNLFVCLFCCHVWPAATLRLRLLLEFFAVFI